MTLLEAAVWALLGGGVAEALNTSATMRPFTARGKWRWPTRRCDMPIFVVAVVLRLLAGPGLAAPLAASQQIPTAFAAWMTGLAAPLLVAKLFQNLTPDPELPP
jgi:hypothetical protein